MKSSQLVILVVAAVVLLCANDAMGATTGCPTFCTLEYRPSCGTRADGSTKEFANPCDRRTYECRTKIANEFVSVTEGRCPGAA